MRFRVWPVRAPLAQEHHDELEHFRDAGYEILLAVAFPSAQVFEPHFGDVFGRLAYHAVEDPAQARVAQVRDAPAAPISSRLVDKEIVAGHFFYLFVVDEGVRLTNLSDEERGKQVADALTSGAM